MILKTVIGKIEKILIKKLIFQLQSSAFFSQNVFYNGLQFAFVRYNLSTLDTFILNISVKHFNYDNYFLYE